MSKGVGGTDPLGVADLRQGGVLSQRLPGYQERPAQIEMATLVAEALTRGTHAILEAPTGVGKSLAYLLPIVRSGKVAAARTALLQRPSLYPTPYPAMRGGTRQSHQQLRVP